MLDGYLDQIIESEVYLQKKNELFEEKLKIQEQISKISKDGSSWLEPMEEFLNCALRAQKIARAKHNGEELSFFAKKVGSDYSLFNRRLFCEYKRGFGALAAGAGAASALPDSPSSSKLWAVMDSNH